MQGILLSPTIISRLYICDEFIILVVYLRQREWKFNGNFAVCVLRLRIIIEESRKREMSRSNGLTRYRSENCPTESGYRNIRHRSPGGRGLALYSYTRSKRNLYLENFAPSEIAYIGTLEILWLDHSLRKRIELRRLYQHEYIALGTVSSVK